MLPGSRSCGNPCYSEIPSRPVGILAATESHLRPSRLPHSCPTRKLPPCSGVSYMPAGLPATAVAW